MGDFPQNLREIQSLGRKTREVRTNASMCPALRRREIIWTGLSWASREFRFIRHCPKIAQVLVCLGGEGRVLFQNRWQPCVAGQAYLTPSGQLHGYHAVRDWRIAWIVFDPGDLLSVLSEPDFRSVDPRPFEHVVSGLCGEASLAPYPPLIEHWVELLYLQCVKLLCRNRPASLWHLWQKVKTELDASWTLEKLSRCANMSAEKLRLVCQQELACSPMAQVTRLRMQHAGSLLAAGQKVEFVARCVGYENSFAFSTAFKRVMHRSPREFARHASLELVKK